MHGPQRIFKTGRTLQIESEIPVLKTELSSSTRSSLKGKTLEERFMSKVGKSDGCWEWRGCKNQDGYGGFLIRGVCMKSHRVSWILHKGSIQEGCLILHKCDNPCCVNPEHLFLGSQKDNMDDCRSKGRMKKRTGVGETHHNAKMTDCLVREIRKKRLSGVKISSLCLEYGFSQSHICSVIAGRKWGHVV